MPDYSVDLCGRNIRVEGPNGNEIVEIDIQVSPEIEVLEDAKNFFDSLFAAMGWENAAIKEIAADTPLDRWLMQRFGLEYEEELDEVRWDEKQTIHRSEVVKMAELCSQIRISTYNVVEVTDELEKLWLRRLPGRVPGQVMDKWDENQNYKKGIEEYNYFKLLGFDDDCEYGETRKFIREIAEVLVDPENFDIFPEGMDVYGKTVDAQEVA